MTTVLISLVFPNFGEADLNNLNNLLAEASKTRRKPIVCRIGSDEGEMFHLAFQDGELSTV